MALPHHEQIAAAGDQTISLVHQRGLQQLVVIGVALAVEVHQVALPVAELTAKISFCRPLVDGGAVGDGGLAPAIASPPAALRLALRQKPRQPRLSPGQAVGMAGWTPR